MSHYSALYYELSRNDQHYFEDTFIPRRSVLTERQHSALFDLPTYGSLLLRHRRQTQQQHLLVLRQIYGFKMFSGQGAGSLTAWRKSEAEAARSNHDLA